MRIHLIAIGGSIMHNLAISLQKAGHSISGSDDEIYEPARSRLLHYGLLPSAMGWNPSRITEDIDLVILGMHARADNPELICAQDQAIKVMSFPEFIADQSNDKVRIVVAGSHGKTTTTSMIMHVLKDVGMDFDYLVGAQLAGFETMVQLSDASKIIIEGDEYLSSALDRVPKIWHYEPQITIITGIAWDHMNVFPTFDDYLAAFSGFLERMPIGGKVIYFKSDPNLEVLKDRYSENLEWIPYEGFSADNRDGQCFMYLGDREIPLKVFGSHNLANLKAAWLVLADLGIKEDQFATSISQFTGAAKRLQILNKTANHITYQDFAHAPSKVEATVQAVRELYPERDLTACVELHTYSSLNKDFLPLYLSSLDHANHAVIYYDKHTLEMKKMPPLMKSDITRAFGRDDLHVFTDKDDFLTYLRSQNWSDHNLLLMSSGKFGGINMADASGVSK